MTPPTTRRPVKFFVSYAHGDQRAADGCMALLQTHLKLSRHHDFTLWRDTALLLGERWRKEIADAISACDFGLLLVSPNFLASDFITTHELPAFVNGGPKPVLPVLLEPVSFAHHDLKGLEDHQLYRLNRDRAYGECSTAAQRGRFNLELFEQIERRLQRHFGA